MVNGLWIDRRNEVACDSAVECMYIYGIRNVAMFFRT